MAYLSNSSVIVDAILTDKGREALAKGDGSFKITQFALADDEIDYSLFNEDHPDGSAYYGEAIESLPIIEAIPKSNYIMKHKLITLPRGTSKLPILDLGFSNITLNLGTSFEIKPSTLNLGSSTNSVEPNGYLITVGDRRLLSNFVGLGLGTRDIADLAASFDRTSLSETVIGKTVSLTALNTTSLFGDKSTLITTLTVEGRDSGARITIPLQINKTALASTTSIDGITAQ